MVCPKCGSEKVTIQVVNETKLKIKHHSIIWWCLIGWWFVPIMWFIFFIPKLFIKLFGLSSKKYKTKNITKKIAVCQNCTNSFEIK